MTRPELDPCALKILTLACLALALGACGSGDESAGSGGSDGPSAGDGDGDGDGFGSRGGDSSGDSGDGEPIDELSEGSDVDPEPGDQIDLGFGTLTTTLVGLPGGHLNAAEVYQLSHYIARTDQEIHEGDIDTPIRSYVAACNTETDTPHLFVSVSLAAGETPEDATFGSVYELIYDPATGFFTSAGNAAILPSCYESHGIAASPDCSRVGVLCNMNYAASDRYDGDVDIIEQHGTEWMKWQDNHGEIDARLENDIGLMLSTNFGKFMNFFTEHERLTIADFLPGLQSNFPENNFDDSTTFNALKGREMAEEVEWLVGQLSAEDRDDLFAHVRANAYKENDQIWLLEWDGKPLAEEPDSYVVNKMHGGTHTGAEELMYVGNDSRGRSSYAFSVTARVFDPNGGSHYSAGLTVVNRDDWSIRVAGSGVAEEDERGWYWACGNGHLLNIRGFYNSQTEQYGAICTSDGNDWVGGIHGQLGTIAIKMEDRSATNEGRSVHMVPAANDLTSNGGGHTVVPVDADNMLALVVAPKLIADEDMNRMLTEEIGVEPGSPDVDQACADFDSVNCFFTYLSWEYWEEDGRFPSRERQAMRDGGMLDATSLTRIGLGKVDGGGAMTGNGFNWIVEDDDCQISDPQLIDLHNGRYLLGYARFQCVSEGLGYNRIFSTRGANRMLQPKSYHVMEIDADGNVLEGPVEVPNHGWGGIDEPMLLAPGRVAWTYIPNPTIGNYGGGQQDRWEILVYQSNATP